MNFAKYVNTRPRPASRRDAQRIGGRFSAGYLRYAMRPSRSNIDNYFFKFATKRLNARTSYIFRDGAPIMWSNASGNSPSGPR